MIVADEPTGNLDKQTESEILDIFKKLAHEEGKCVIIVTHSPNVCDIVDEVSAALMYEKTRCDFIMVGRAACGRPWSLRCAMRGWSRPIRCTTAMSPRMRRAASSLPSLLIKI